MLRMNVADYEKPRLNNGGGKRQKLNRLGLKAEILLKLTQAQLMSFYLLMKREQGKRTYLWT